MDRLHATNNFPEFTGRLCPAPCETACVLGHQPGPGHDQERRGRDHRPRLVVRLRTPAPARVALGPHRRRDRLRPRRARRRPAADAGRAHGRGLRAGRQDRRPPALRHPRVQDGEGRPRPPARPDEARGHGLPRRRRRRRRADRRQPAASGTTPWCSRSGRPSAATCRCPGRELDGIHQAMEYLPQSNRASLGEEVPDQITATGKDVVIIGGGDTGADCLGTAIRQGAASVTQLEILAQPPVDRPGRPALAHLPDDVPGLVGPRGGRRPGVRRVDPGVPRRRVGPGPRAAPGRGRRVVPARRGQRARDPGRARAAGHGLHRSGAAGADRAARGRRSTSAATSPATRRTPRAWTASSSPATRVAVSR